MPVAAGSATGRVACQPETGKAAGAPPPTVSRHWPVGAGPPAGQDWISRARATAPPREPARGFAGGGGGAPSSQPPSRWKITPFSTSLIGLPPTAVTFVTI